MCESANIYYKQNKEIEDAEEVKLYTKEIILKKDPIYRFLDDHIIFTDNRNDQIGTSDLYDLYVEKNPKDEEIVSSKKFHLYISERCPNVERLRKRTYTNMKINPDSGKEGKEGKEEKEEKEEKVKVKRILKKTKN
jgi:hypothetical protein